jgi:thiol-disulfide isomerase/thioredoxin
MTRNYTLCLGLLLLLGTDAALAQKAVKIYRTKEGKLYSQVQKDSIAGLGFGIAETNLTKKGDTSYIGINVLPKSSPDEQAFVKRHKNKPLPAFRLKTLAGKEITNKDLKGKVVMINFWSTTCGPCIKEMPELNEMKKQYQDVVFLAPAPEDAATVEKLIAKYPFDFEILPNAKKVFEEWGIDSYPKNFFVDRQGIIREVKEGTPLYREKKGDEWQVAVIRTYAPIITNLMND